MSTDQRDSMEPVSRDEDTLDADRQIVGRRGYVLGILIAALNVAYLSVTCVRNWGKQKRPALLLNGSSHKNRSGKEAEGCVIIHEER